MFDVSSFLLMFCNRSHRRAREFARWLVGSSEGVSVHILHAFCCLSSVPLSADEELLVDGRDDYLESYPN